MRLIRRRVRRRRRMRMRQMMKVIQSLIPLVRALTGILGQLPWYSFSIFIHTVPPYFLFHFGLFSLSLDSYSLVFCHPSAVPDVADTPNMCLNIKCMANILPKASDPEGQREYLSVKTRASSPVSVPPKKRTFSPWCVPHSHLTLSSNLLWIERQAQHTLCISPPQPIHPFSIPLSPDLNQRQVSFAVEKALLYMHTSQCGTTPSPLSVYISLYLYPAFQS